MRWVLLFLALLLITPSLFAIVHAEQHLHHQPLFNDYLPEACGICAFLIACLHHQESSMTGVLQAFLAFFLLLVSNTFLQRMGTWYPNAITQVSQKIQMNN